MTNENTEVQEEVVEEKKETSNTNSFDSEKFKKDIETYIIEMINQKIMDLVNPSEDKKDKEEVVKELTPKNFMF